MRRGRMRTDLRFAFLDWCVGVWSWGGEGRRGREGGGGGEEGREGEGVLVMDGISICVY